MKLKMLDKVEKILQENTLCVLCTDGEGIPYCSLMTYMPSFDLKILYMISIQESKKYKNILSNPDVSVLIDTRQRISYQSDKKIISITFEGVYQLIAQNEIESIKSRFANEHIELDEIIKSPGVAIFAIKLKSFLLLDGAVNSFKGNM